MNKFEDNGKRSFGYRFAMLHRLQMAMCRKDILKLGMKSSQLPFVLFLVRENEPVTQDYLSARLSIDKGSTARALSQLEKNGFVIRRFNPENRRQKLVSPTPKAFNAAEKVLPSLERSMNNFIRGFDEKEQKMTLEILDRMLANAIEALKINK